MTDKGLLAQTPPGVIQDNTGPIRLQLTHTRLAYTQESPDMSIKEQNQVFTFILHSNHHSNTLVGIHSSTELQSSWP